VVKIQGPNLYVRQIFCRTVTIRTNVPRINRIKNARKKLNQTITDELGIQLGTGSVKLNPDRVFELLKKKAKTTSINISFDHRKNEGRDEVLLGFIPIIDTHQHSPTKVFPIALFCG